MLLFSYGSNSPAQLRTRLGRPVSASAAKLPGYERVYRGQSKRWGGGVASLRRRRGRTTHGSVVPITKKDLSVLDRFEGVGAGKYKRVKKTVAVREDGKWARRPAVMYTSTSRRASMPTDEYLKAVRKNLNLHKQAAQVAHVNAPTIATPKKTNVPVAKIGPPKPPSILSGMNRYEQSWNTKTKQGSISSEMEAVFLEELEKRASTLVPALRCLLGSTDSTCSKT